MSAIAQVLREQGHVVSGSDRNYDTRVTPLVFSALASRGILLHPQDGSGVHEGTDFVVISSAIEEQNPDVKKALTLNKKIIKRADLLAGMVNGKHGIAIGGTNGKTTVSCMTGYILDYAGLSPTIIVGGCIKNFANGTTLGNAKTGTSNIIAVEADESDGSIVLYTPHTSVITNVSKDHKPIEEIAVMFETFSRNTRETLILNADCPRLKKLDLHHKNVQTYGFNGSASVNAKDVVCQPFHSRFEVDGQAFEIGLPGAHNVSNALAAISVARSLGIPDGKIAAALRQFQGVQRRMDVIGEFKGVKVIDDYAHNPEKVMAMLRTVKLGCKRVLAIFQPHGYGPTSFMKDEYIEAFVRTLSPDDVLFMPEIFYAGGTAGKNVSSADIVARIKEGGKNACFIERRDDIIPAIKNEVSPGDCVLVMGARDNTLTDFCRKILRAMQNDG